MKLDGKDLRAYSNLAETYCDLKRLHEAIEVYWKILTIKPDHHESFVKLAIIYQELATSITSTDERLKYLSEALTCYERVLQISDESLVMREDIQAACTKLRSSIEFYQLTDDQL